MPIVKVVKEQEKPGGSQVVTEACSTGREHPGAHSVSLFHLGLGGISLWQPLYAKELAVSFYASIPPGNVDQFCSFESYGACSHSNTLQFWEG